MHVDQVDDRAHSRARPLDDDERRTRGNDDGALAPVAVPRRRREVEGTGSVQLAERRDEQVIPLVEGLVPVDVVDVQHLRAGGRGYEHRRERGLAGAAAAVHRDDSRAAGVRPGEGEDIAGEGAGIAGLPRADWRFLRLEHYALANGQSAPRKGGGIRMDCHGADTSEDAGRAGPTRFWQMTGYPDYTT